MLSLLIQSQQVSCTASPSLLEAVPHFLHALLHGKMWEAGQEDGALQNGPRDCQELQFDNGVPALCI